ncbi:MAG TPA: glycosyltransferase family 2 protein [Steroidobacteraceae bacterium]|nr:glycosyltransferase family 2 protein [Steroidobacteraceae bacterium]
MPPDEPLAAPPAGGDPTAKDLVLDIVIPVYNEGSNILKVLKALDAAVQTPARVLICYDRDDDDTLSTIAEHWTRGRLPIVLVRNRGSGAHGAVMTGLLFGSAPYALMYPGDDDYNAGILDSMVAKAREGNDIVCASRFIPSGSMVGCPLLKACLVRAAATILFHFAGVATRDPTNGFRLFSRRVLEQIKVESTQGFTYSLELLVKTQRLGWGIAEVPAQWFERSAGQSRFRVLRWIPAYLRWVFYAFGTAYGRRPPASVALNRKVP